MVIKMKIADKWQDYELIDASGGERLERWGNYTLIRPDPQVLWENENPAPDWNRADARYLRSGKGGGHWDYREQLPESWHIRYNGLTFKVKPTGFKHTGLFPEQAVNWDWCAEAISRARLDNRAVSVLNLFAYTGGATLACLKAGARVCHLDAVKGMVAWAKENAALSGLTDKPARWITDDAVKFLNREMKRGNRYDAVILDPPSYGRGTGGEMWKLEDSLFGLVKKCAEVLSDKPLFLLLNTYTTGLSGAAVEYLLRMAFGDKRGVGIKAEEIGLPVKRTGLVMPCGYTAVAEFLF